MPVELKLKSSDSLPIDVRNVSGDESPVDIGKTLIFVGNQSVQASEVFDIDGDNADDQTIVWSGGLSHVHHIGHGNSTAKIVIAANTGDHVGSEMTGGEIFVQGSVRDYAGTQMRGGIIRIKKNAGDFVGGALAGSKAGMNRGSILIDGDVGENAGAAMRRGTIVCGGTAGRGLGTDMLAGTIVVFGECTSATGINMKRGTIIAATRSGALNLSPVNFGASGTSRPPVVAMFARWLDETKFEYDRELLWSREFAQYAGDLVNGGRGELFIGV